MPIVEEALRIEKTREEAGAVRVRVEAETTQAECEVGGSAEHVAVERRVVNAVVDARREPWIDDGAIVVPVYEEVIERRLVLKEEIRLVRRRATTTERRTVALRREHAVVERRQPDGSWRPVQPANDAARDVPEIPVSPSNPSKEE